MYLSLFVGALGLYGMVLHVPTSAKHMCHFYNCFDTGQSPPCFSSHCYADIVCNEGTTVDIGKVYYGTNKFWYSTGDCRNVCNGDVSYNQTSTNGIMKLCNGLQKCSLRQWNTGTHWIIDVIYKCQETISASKTIPNISSVTLTTPISTSKNIATSVAKTQTNNTDLPDNVTASSPKLASSFGQHTYKSGAITASKTSLNVSSGTSITSVPTSNDDASSVAASEAEHNDLSVQFPVATVVSSFTTGVVVSVCVFIGIVCIRRRKGTKEIITTMNAQHNDSSTPSIDNLCLEDLYIVWRMKMS